MVNIIVRQYKNKKAFAKNAKAKIAWKKCCRGRDRTSTGQLVVAQSSVVDPGRSGIATKTALCYIYPVFPTPETRGHVCQKAFKQSIQKAGGYRKGYLFFNYYYKYITW